MHRLSGFVHQEDLFYGTLTVLEHLTCMAHMKLDRKVSSHEISYIIKDVLDRTGLSHCLHTRIGYEGDGKVMSGGEKKRLAFATELLTQPAILFCKSIENNSIIHNINVNSIQVTSQQQDLIRSMLKNSY
jgi:ATP-binding cassette, subfamily G (WHITE), eye pigment precursor transporter